MDQGCKHQDTGNIGGHFGGHTLQWDKCLGLKLLTYFYTHKLDITHHFLKLH